MALHDPRKVKHSNQLNNLPIKQIFSGIYRVCNKKSGEVINGINYTSIELHDATGLQIGQCETDAISWYQNKPYELVTVKGYLEQSANQSLLHIMEIKPMNSLVNIGTTLSLPRRLSLDPIWLDRLMQIRRSIESPALGRFVDSIFADDDLAFAFLQVPASSKYHHNYAGGLLAHSVEVAEITSNQQHDNKDVRDIAVVCALLHDIGKVKTLGVNLSSTVLGKVVGHDSLTLEICASTLKELDKAWPEASYTMRHVWSCSSPGAKYGFERNSTIANIIQFADKLSVDRYYERETFKANNKNDGLAWDGKKYYWRPAAEPQSIERNNICLLTNTR
jgi:3'-5' exoribonuclease